MLELLLGMTEAKRWSGAGRGRGRGSKLIKPFHEEES
jgi:hypothetical protein